MDCKVEFNPSFEPVVIIEDDSDEDSKELNGDYERDPLATNTEDLIRSIGPEISIIPVKKKRPQIKIKLFEKEYSPSKDDVKVQSGSRAPRTHVRQVSKDEAEQAEETYTRRKSSPLEKCPICKKFFRRMKTHLLKHDGYIRASNDPLMCNLCMKVFNTHSNLQIHIRSHTGDKPYVCEVCNKSFSQSCNLVNHMRTHTGEKPFKCPHCDKAFTQSGNLNNHIRLHTDEKPFKCHFCDKAFVQSGNLSSHIKNNHKFKEEPGYIEQY
ncbi:unnamed protein product [Brassicogethes aeneus]|uniref:Protein krueppel n=1 Tax=Brassicogethes aeneus TaxID=1431903 RepID=A0A9P0FJM8_BRAAE|nr:unnamed protein product [Brassicogethes aeneus]